MGGKLRGRGVDFSWLRFLYVSPAARLYSVARLGFEMVLKPGFETGLWFLTEQKLVLSGFETNEKWFPVLKTGFYLSRNWF